MNFIVISLVSLKGTLAFGTSINGVPKVLSFYDWISQDNSGLSADITKAWSELLKTLDPSTGLNSISEIYVVSGPGSFTGIRVGSAFASGLALGLGIPAYSIFTYDMFDVPVGIPIRMHKAYETLSKNCGEAEIEFLFLDESSQIISRLADARDTLLGVSDADQKYKDWPTKEQIELGLKKALFKKQPLKPCYGLSPKVFGKRS